MRRVWVLKAAYKAPYTEARQKVDLSEKARYYSPGTLHRAMCASLLYSRNIFCSLRSQYCTSHS